MSTNLQKESLDEVDGNNIPYVVNLYVNELNLGAMTNQSFIDAEQ
jgi:hypothetical protein